MDTIELGGNINLAGFKDLEPQKLIVIKKIVGNFVKKFQEHNKDFNNLVVDLKKIHGSQSEILAKMTINNKTYNAEVTDFNLFFALNKAFQKIESQLP
ncbi:MAG: hypothetical protein KJ674_01105 [Nanoarchaeota archaeon]|nr:hypothetical protein [Nanoarchaeota archaeon]